MNHTKGTLEDANETCGQGSICAHYNELVAAFGEPLGPSGDGKVQAEWVVKFENGIIATIYDWKQYGVPPCEIVNWNIGGRSWLAEHNVNEVLLELRAANDDHIDESMDGDFDSGMASAGFGTDEDYGCFGDETYGADF